MLKIDFQVNLQDTDQVFPFNNSLGHLEVGEEETQLQLFKVLIRIL